MAATTWVAITQQYFRNTVFSSIESFHQFDLKTTPAQINVTVLIRRSRNLYAFRGDVALWRISLNVRARRISPHAHRVVNKAGRRMR